MLVISALTGGIVRSFLRLAVAAISQWLSPSQAVSSHLVRVHPTHWSYVLDDVFLQDFPLEALYCAFQTLAILKPNFPNGPMSFRSVFGVTGSVYVRLNSAAGSS
jgi:hypothetical protein